MVQSIRVLSCPFVVLCFLFVYFVCFVVQSIRTHSCPFVTIRGSTHSCPFVVLGPFRVFRVFRGSTHSCPFVSIRVHSWFLDQFQRKFFHEMFETTCFEIICRLNHRGVVILGFSLHELPGTMWRKYIQRLAWLAKVPYGIPYSLLPT